jgi:hypothetical protein
MSRWTTAQRVVIVVAWAGVLQAIWTWLRNDGVDSSDGGWFNYAPNSGVVFSPDPPWPLINPTAAIAIQVLLVVLWAAPSFWLLGVRQVEEPSGVEGDAG